MDAQSLFVFHVGRHRGNCLSFALKLKYYLKQKLRNHVLYALTSCLYFCLAVYFGISPNQTDYLQSHVADLTFLLALKGKGIFGYVFMQDIVCRLWIPEDVFEISGVPPSVIKMWWHHLNVN